LTTGRVKALERGRLENK